MLWNVHTTPYCCLFMLDHFPMVSFILFNSLISNVFFYNSSFSHDTVWISPPHHFPPSHLKSTQANWSSTPLQRESMEQILEPSVLLHLSYLDVHKPTIWLETAIVELYGWIHFHSVPCRIAEFLHAACISSWFWSWYLHRPTLSTWSWRAYNWKTKKLNMVGLSLNWSTF